MDESRRSGGPFPAKSSWEKDNLPAGGLGATDVFGAMPGPSGGPIFNSLAWNDQSPGKSGLPGGAENPPHAQALSDREVLREPIVHNVVLGGGSETTPDHLLSLLSANKVSEPARGPAPFEPQWPSGPTALGPVAGRPPEAPSVGSSEGFTQLLRALSGDTSWAATVERPEVDQAFALNSVSARVAPPSESMGSFTALLQGFSETGPNYSGRRPNETAPFENLGSRSPESLHTAERPAADRSTPGGFTQVLSTLNPGASGSVAPEPVATNPQITSPSATSSEEASVSLPSVSESSFTRLVSTFGEPPHKPPISEDTRPETVEDFSQRPTLREQHLSAADQLPAGVTNWSETTLPSTEPSTGSGGLTDLIRILDEPNRRSENPVAYAPAGDLPAPPESGSGFTDTYSLLDKKAETPAPRPYSWDERPSSVPVSAPIPQTPPSFQWQQPVPPAVPPGQPPNFNGAVQMPHYAAPAPVQQASAPAPAMGKMQQYLPLLLIVIIFLLIVILVTVVFLLKK